MAWVFTCVLAACGGDDSPLEVDAAVQPDASACPAPITVFLNAGGGSYTGGPDNTSTNTSTVLSDPATIPAYPGTLDLPALTTCVADKFAAFNVTITSVDPGTAPHREIVFVDGSQSLGFPAGIGGISPFACPTMPGDLMPRAIAYVFPVQGQTVTEVCELTAQMIGNTFSLDHAFECADVMTYLTGCGDKSFVDMDVPCGENEARACNCGGTTQNSYQTLLSVAGAACE